MPALCLQILDKVKPEGIEVVGWLAMVRNSVGSGKASSTPSPPSPPPHVRISATCISLLCAFLTDCYVSDEVITSRAGVRVRVVNTDAEGRMVMADLLCKAKQSVMSMIFINNL